MELCVGMHGTKTHGLATRNGAALMGESRAQQAEKGQGCL